MIDAFKKYWQNYFDFKGVSSRPDFWWSWLCLLICGIVVGILLVIFNALNVQIIGKIIDSLFALATLIPSLAITVRRLRDAGYKWTWIFISLVPLAGPIILIVLLCKPTKA